jgi:hypothetical protein
MTGSEIGPVRAAELRVVFARRRVEGALFGLSAAQLVLAVVALFLVVAAVNGRSGWGWWLAGAVVLLVLIVARFHGRSWADIGPALMVEALMRIAGWHVFRGGPVRGDRADDRAFMVGQPMLPGALSRLRFGAYQVGRDGPPVCVVTDTADGTVTVVLAVQGTGGALTDTATLNAHAAAFGSLLNGIARGRTPVLGLQILHRVIPDQGDEVWREARRRGQAGSRFAWQAYRALLAAHADGGLRHESYVVLRLDPARDAEVVREFGGGPEAAAALAVRWVSTLRRQLRSCGVDVLGWLPPRGVAAVLRSAYDPASDRMVKRRGGGDGDTMGGDDGLPSGVDPAAAGPMYGRRAMSYYAHHDQVTRTWWIQQWPHAKSGVPVGFLQPLLLALPHRHTVSLLLTPVPPRKASRQTNTASSSVETRQHLNRKIGRRRQKTDDRELADLDRREDDAVDGHATFRVAGLVSVTTTPDRLETATADTESALNECNLEGQRWILETDQAFAMAALPLARGLA